MTNPILVSIQTFVGGKEFEPIFPDPRTKDLFLIDWYTMLGVCGAYVAAVVLGKSMMENQKKYDLYWLRVLHNGLLTAFNFYLVVEIIRQSVVVGYGEVTRGEKGLGMAKVLYLYYLSKIWEFLDTFIMVLRKSNAQISFLHVYHHVSVTVMWWFNVYYYPGGEAWPSAWLNSFVHVWMYGYYLLATLGYEAWWKRYLTMLQISQLTVFVLQGITIWLVPDNPRFAFIGVLNSTYALTLLVLFLKFYKSSYAAKPKPTTAPTNPKASQKPKKDD